MGGDECRLGLLKQSAVLHPDQTIRDIQNSRVMGHHQHRTALVTGETPQQLDDFTTGL